MNVYDARGLAAGAVAADSDRPATALIHDAADARLMLFRLGPGQQVPVHTSRSTVILMVVSGSGSGIMRIVVNQNTSCGGSEK